MTKADRVAFRNGDTLGRYHIILKKGIGLQDTCKGTSLWPSS